MNTQIVIFIGLLILVNSFSENCQTCLDSETFVWGVDVHRNMVPGTTSQCWGILSCNQAVCATYRIEAVSFAVLQINNTNVMSFKEYKVLETCTEGQTFISGVNSEYDSMPGATCVCGGLLSCNEAICSISKMPNISFILVAPAHG